MSLILKGYSLNLKSEFVLCNIDTDTEIFVEFEGIPLKIFNVLKSKLKFRKIFRTQSAYEY